MGHVNSILRIRHNAISNKRAVPMFVVSLDALGTLYRFREPVSVQYLNCARQCGLKTDISPQDLEKSFRTTFKHYTQTYPNYGKGKLESPREWWTGLINDAFVDATGLRTLPSHLGPTLYTHFSSEAAYQPYPDSFSFLKSMHALRKQYSDPEGPLLCVGVVTNSDSRVRPVLESMGFRVGLSEYGVTQEKETLRRTSDGISIIPPSLRLLSYDPGNDFDFLATSYDAGSEKPDGGIWAYAKGFIEDIAPTRAERALAVPQEPRQFSVSNSVAKNWRDSQEVMLELTRSERERVRICGGKVSWVHIGDELKKDYEGARKFGHEALHLEREREREREGAGRGGEANPAGGGIHTISSLEEAAMIVNVMAKAHFEANSARSAAGATSA
ncbi:uncharacterized protein A1O9_06111 [Exophiala aquamarina CBS 119918]|uniref:Haloacid dehalogenase, type II n=1 Tax=Exophiala aquamarina CBS 119918 TaxID=1182545 RepID=A0A072PRP4_9EURO|nr:uncharacterized protein A1O9_06111 [Exophiala aquamarina CBS 119918]KEF58185.1 hypothetical protein A1O9_06111 [Exophiala aquamarina CBS 119918]